MDVTCKHKKKKMTTIESILHLNKIFKSNNWTERDIDEFVFDNFCKLLDNLNNEQRKLIIELVDRYKWISFAEYPEKILATLESIEQEKLDKLSIVYLFPVIKLEDEGGFKSGQFLIYQIKAFKRHLKKFKNITFKYVSKFDNLTNPDFKLKNTEAIFLIDDYIGSGETLNACLHELKINPAITYDKINVITIASQIEISKELEKLGISFYASYYSQRGITDYNKSPIVEEKIKIMLEIEKMIPGGSHFSFGYNQSEALITLARTPDNTFPIFWKTYRVGKQKYLAPFSREETIEL
jgi:hypothetical protein